MRQTIIVREYSRLRRAAVDTWGVRKRGPIGEKMTPKLGRKPPPGSSSRSGQRPARRDRLVLNIDTAIGGVARSTYEDRRGTIIAHTWETWTKKRPQPR